MLCREILPQMPCVFWARYPTTKLPSLWKMSKHITSSNKRWFTNWVFHTTQPQCQSDHFIRVYLLNPTHLPPQCQSDHFIPLFPNLVLVSVKPYIYPHARILRLSVKSISFYPLGGFNRAPPWFPCRSYWWIRTVLGACASTIKCLMHSQLRTRFLCLLWEFPPFFPSFI